MGAGPSKPILSRPVVVSISVAVLLAGLACDRPTDRTDEPTSVKRPFNVVVIVFDALRPDYVSCYARNADERKCETPNIDRLAARGFIFENARTVAPSSPQSHLALFTGQDQDPAALSLPALLRRADPAYFTIGVCANSNVTPDRMECLKGAFSLFHGPPYWKLDSSAFAAYLMNEHGYPLNAKSFHYMSLHAGNTNILIERYLKWYVKQSPQSPFMLFVNYTDAHDPYFPHPEYEKPLPPEGPRRFNGDVRQRQLRDRKAKTLPDGNQAVAPWAILNGLTEDDVERIRELYIGEVRYVDRHFGHFLKFLEQEGLYDDTLFVLVSDHGESLGEHGHLTHSGPPYEECMKIVMIVVPPARLGLPPQRISRPVTILDAAPTIARFLGVSFPVHAGSRPMLTLEESPLFAGEAQAFTGLTADHRRLGKDSGPLHLTAKGPVADTTADLGLLNRSGDLEAWEIEDLRRRGLITARSDDEEAIKRQIKGLRALGYVGD